MIPGPQLQLKLHSVLLQRQTGETERPPRSPDHRLNTELGPLQQNMSALELRVFNCDACNKMALLAFLMRCDWCSLKGVLENFTCHVGCIPSSFTWMQGVQSSLPRCETSLFPPNHHQQQHLRATGRILEPLRGACRRCRGAPQPGRCNAFVCNSCVLAQRVHTKAALAGVEEKKEEEEEATSQESQRLVDVNESRVQCGVWEGGRRRRRGPVDLTPPPPSLSLFHTCL